MLGPGFIAGVCCWAGAVTRHSGSNPASSWIEAWAGVGSMTLSGEKSFLREMEMLGGMQQCVIGEELGNADLAGDANKKLKKRLCRPCHLHRILLGPPEFLSILVSCSSVLAFQ